MANKMNKVARKLTTVRITLVMLQLTSLTIASIIIIIYYNPWIGRIIDEAERSGNTGRSLADQIRRTDNEELVIFLMSATTILVSLLGIIGALRNYEHNHCLLNFYMSTLIIFLFVVFVALCGTIWEVFGKLHRSSSYNHFHHQTVTISPEVNIAQLDQNQKYLTTDFNVPSSTLSTNISNRIEDRLSPPPLLTPTPTINQNTVSWWYIGKSFILITFSAALYATSLKLTRKILESSDDRYLSANECDVIDDNDDLNSECSIDGCTGGPATYPYVAVAGLGNIHNAHPIHHHHHRHHHHHHRYPYQFTSDIYHNNGDGTQMAQANNNPSGGRSGHIGASKSSLGSQFRTIL